MKDKRYPSELSFTRNRTLIDGHEEFAAKVRREVSEAEIKTANVAASGDFVIASEAGVE